MATFPCYRTNCSLPAVGVCSGCLLVKYCGKACQTQDRAKHRQECLIASGITNFCGVPHCSAYEAENILPLAMAASEFLKNTKTLWGETPAKDVLDGCSSEGLRHNEDLRLCFRTANDLRHIMKTVIALPEGYKGDVTIIVNEPDPDLSLRNVMMLRLAGTKTESEAELTELAQLMTHFWFSAYIPPKLHELIQGSIFKDIDAAHKASQLFGEEMYQENWTAFGIEMVISLLPRDWKQLRSVFDPSKRTPEYVAECERKRDDLTRQGYKMLYDALRYTDWSISPAQKWVLFFYRYTGVLMAYGARVAGFHYPNPTFFTPTGEFLLHPGSSPTAVTNDHELYKVCQAQGIPPKDSHGALLYWTMELIQDFIRRVRQLNITFKLCSVSRNELPGTILEEFLENEKAFVWIDAE